ncbi:hypothetical protein EV121DRAFT_218249, partial [Schizophyllum commune]
VCVDGRCICNGTPAARTGAGVHFGIGSPRNISARVRGAQASERGEGGGRHLSIVVALSTTDSQTLLTIYSAATARK